LERIELVRMSSGMKKVNPNSKEVGAFLSKASLYGPTTGGSHSCPRY